MKNLMQQYNTYIEKQKYYLYKYKAVKASQFLIDTQEKLANKSFSCWIVWKVKSKIKYSLLGFYYKIIHY
jgi:hypothetical protein